MASNAGLSGRSVLRPSIAEIVAAGIWVLCAVFFFSDTALGFLSFLFLLTTGLLLAAVWCIRFLMVMVPAISQGATPARAALRLVAWAFIPVCGFVGAIALTSDRDLSVRFRLSEAPLTRFAETALAAGPGAAVASDRWVGLFHVEHVDVEDGRVRLTTASDMIDPCGLWYSPSGHPPQEGESVRRLRGNWYVFKGH